jgi:hypothetical protein
VQSRTTVIVPLNQRVIFVRFLDCSGVGDDALGNEALQRLRHSGCALILFGGIERIPQHRFENVAWDFLEFGEAEAQLATIRQSISFAQSEQLPMVSYLAASKSARARNSTNR